MTRALLWAYLSWRRFARDKRRGCQPARIGVPDVDEVQFLMTGVPEAYIRIIPTRPRERPIPVATLNQVAAGAELLRTRGFGGFTCLNKYGVLFYDPNGPHRGGPAPLHAATQLMRNGELWSISDNLIIRTRNGRPARFAVTTPSRREL